MSTEVEQLSPPWELIRAVEKKFGSVAVDLAATVENAKAARFITPEIDTFTQDWTVWLDGGLGWLNPEFDPMVKWVGYCAQQQQRGAEFVVLSPASVSTNYKGRTFLCYSWSLTGAWIALQFIKKSL